MRGSLRLASMLVNIVSTMYSIFIICRHVHSGASSQFDTIPIS